MSKVWIDFADLVAIVSEKLGSRTLSFGEINRILQSGDLRAVADRSDIYELTGEIMRTYEHELNADWWRVENRFRRSPLTGRMTLMVPEKSAKFIEGGFYLYNPYSYSNIRFYYPDVVRLYGVLNNDSGNLPEKPISQGSGQSPAGNSLRGRPRQSGYAALDRKLFPEIERLLSSGKVQGAHGAALLIADRIAGHGTDDSKAKRVAKLFHQQRGLPP